MQTSQDELILKSVEKFTSFAFAKYLKKEDSVKANVVNVPGNKIVFKNCAAGKIKII